MIRTTVLVLLMGTGLWLSTSLVRSATIPGISRLEQQIWQDWEALKAQNPELGKISQLDIVGSAEGGISKVWANEARLSCLRNNDGELGAEVLMIPLDTEVGPAATVQIYIYDLKSGEFVKEISRLYHL